jgi:quercetin dioxygenase-like cupin family protein
MKYTYPHKIDNGHGEQLTFLKYINNENGGLLEVENNVHPGAGPPMHVHYQQDESLTVVQGKIAAQIAGKEVTYHGPGETVTFKRGVAHRFWNAGNENLICKGWISPVNNVEYFLTEIFNSIKSNGGKAPRAFDGAYLLSRYKSEFDMVEIPGFVKKVIFPITISIGKAFGKDKKFRDAPEPVKS